MNVLTQQWRSSCCCQNTVLWISILTDHASCRERTHHLHASKHAFFEIECEQLEITSAVLRVLAVINNQNTDGLVIFT
jgi:hypothetical protein